MKFENIKVGKEYGFKNVESLNSRLDGERLIVKEVIDEENIIVDFISATYPVLISATEVIYKPYHNMKVDSKEIRR